jgi:hypothetical protein
MIEPARRAATLTRDASIPRSAARSAANFCLKILSAIVSATSAPSSIVANVKEALTVDASVARTMHVAFVEDSMPPTQRGWLINV